MPAKQAFPTVQFSLYMNRAPLLLRFVTSVPHLWTRRSKWGPVKCCHVLLPPRSPFHPQCCSVVILTLQQKQGTAPKEGKALPIFVETHSIQDLHLAVVRPSLTSIPEAHFGATYILSTDGEDGSRITLTLLPLNTKPQQVPPCSPSICIHAWR